MSELKEYVVTLKHKEDLEDFYDDMETPGGNLYIPDRMVEVANRRVVSRNTHYMLSDAEAEEVRNDPRVESVMLTPDELGMVVTKFYTQTSSNFDKSATEDVNDINWGLLRMYEGIQRAGWGTDSTSNQAGTININSTGRNVDVVIVDGHFDPAHPEYAVNADGTGGSRVNQFNWFSITDQVTGGSNGTYVYTPYDNGATSLTDDNSHGSHCAGTACGNTQGWARNANIYNINPYGTNVNSLNALTLFDYIRVWHNNKTVNPATGRTNPTITNNSWGYSFQVPIANITQINYRGGVDTAAPFSANTLLAYGIAVFNIQGTLTAIIPARYPALEADIQDAINDGVLMVGASGNDYTKIDLPGGTDYNNIAVAGGSNYAYHIGSAPSSADNFICVGNIGTHSSEYKTQSSNCGPRVDIHAPGTDIQSSVNSGTSYGGFVDPRDTTNTYYFAKITGTSMASPQVCGILACALETYPFMTQAQAREYVINYAKSGQITDTGGSHTDYTSLQGAPDRYAVFHQERPESGQTWPNNNFWLKDTTTSNKAYPRPRVRRYRL